MGVVAGIIGATAAVAGAGASIYSSNKAAKATKAAAAQQAQFAQQAFGSNQSLISGLSDAAGEFQSVSASLISDAKGSINDAYKQVQNIISRIPSVSQEYPEAQNLSLQDFNFRTDLKRQNLNFALGRTQQGLRSAQVLNTSLANLDPSGFNTDVNRIINSKLLDLKAQTVGEPTGSFANLSAQNLYNFSNQGLSNELAISDFFSKNGTVDPISPLTTAFGLQQVDQSIAGLGIQGAEWQGSSLAGVDEAGISAAGTAFGQQAQVAGLGIQANNQLATGLSNSAGASALASAQQAAAIAPAIGMVAQGASIYGGLSLQNQSLTNQQAYQSQYLSYLNNSLTQRQSLNAFAPSTTIGAGTSAFTNTVNNPSAVSNYSFNGGGYYPSSSF